MFPLFQRFVIALLLLNFQAGNAARKQVERASFQPLIESHDTPEVADVLATAETLLPSVEGVVAPVITEVVAPVIAEVVDVADDGGVPKKAQAIEQEILGAEDGHSNVWLRVSTWLSLFSSLAQSTADVNPGEALSIVFSLSCMAYSFWVFLRYGHDGTITLRLTVIDNQRQQFQKAHDAYTGSTVQTLNALSESVALIAERSFEGKRRHFLKLVRRIRDHPERVGSSSECAPAFRQLVSEWLAVFRECDMGQALWSEEGEELAAGSSVDRVAAAACERLESMSSAEIARELESFMGPLTLQGIKALEKKVETGTFPLTVANRFTLISVWHAVGLFVVFLGLVLAGFQAVERQLWMAAGVFCADACFFVVLLRYDKIDKMCRIEGEVRRLRLQSRAARRRHEQVGAFHKKVQAVTHLWLHRTMPQLEIFGGLFDLLWGPLAGSADVTLYPSLAEKLAQMRSGLGLLGSWCGEEAMHVDQLQDIAGTLCDCADFIKGQQDEAKPECLIEIIRHLDQMQLQNSAQEGQIASAAS